MKSSYVTGAIEYICLEMEGPVKVSLYSNIIAYIETPLSLSKVFYRLMCFVVESPSVFHYWQEYPHIQVTVVRTRAQCVLWVVPILPTANTGLIFNYFFLCLQAAQSPRLPLGLQEELYF